jgi:hypothetical protein
VARSDDLVGHASIALPLSQSSASAGVLVRYSLAVAPHAQVKDEMARFMM